MGQQQSTPIWPAIPKGGGLPGRVITLGRAKIATVALTGRLNIATGPCAGGAAFDIVKLVDSPAAP